MGVWAENELSRLRESVMGAWTVYMSWYTWFFGANLIVLGWIFSSTDVVECSDSKLNSQYMTILASAWMFFNLLGLASTFILRQHTMRMSGLADVVCADLEAQLKAKKSAIRPSASFTGRLGGWGAVANGSSLAVNFFLWGYLLIEAIIEP